MARRRGGNSTPISLFSFQDIITSVTGIMVLVTLMMVLELLQRKMDAPAKHTAKIISEVQPIVEQAEQEIARIQQELARDEQTLRELAGVDLAQVQRELEDLERVVGRLQNDMQAVRGEESQAESRLRRSEAEKTRRASDADTLKDLTERVEKTQRQLADLKSSNRVIYNVSSSASKVPWLVEIGANRLLAAEAGKASTPTIFSGSPQAQVAGFLNWARARNPRSEYFMLLLKPDSVVTFDALRQALMKAGFDIGFDLISASDVAVDPNTGAAPQ